MSHGYLNSSNANSNSDGNEIRSFGGSCHPSDNDNIDANFDFWTGKVNLMITREMDGLLNTRIAQVQKVISSVKSISYMDCKWSREGILSFCNWKLARYGSRKGVQVLENKNAHKAWADMGSLMQNCNLIQWQYFELQVTDTVFWLYTNFWLPNFDLKWLPNY